MIVDEQAWEHAARQLYKALQKREKKKKKKKRKRKYEEDDDDEDDDEMYHLSKDFNDDRLNDPEFRLSRKELREADREGDL